MNPIDLKSVLPNIDDILGGAQVDPEMKQKLQDKLVEAEKKLGIDLDKDGKIGSVTNGKEGLMSYIKNLEDSASQKSAEAPKEEKKEKKKKSGLGGLLKIAAPIVGGIFGGPAGAAAGKAIGDAVGDKV